MTVPNPDQQSLPRLYSVTEISEALGVSTKTVRRWIDAGELAVHHLGRAVRISGEDLDDFLSARRS